MSLIDEDFSPKKETENQEQELECKICKSKIDVNSPILLCENDFNKTITGTLNNIKINVYKIRGELEKVNTTLNTINLELENNKNIHIIAKNKLEIDKLNFEALKKKLKIDLKLNYDAFELNQQQANSLREIMKWTKFAHASLEDLEQENK